MTHTANRFYKITPKQEALLLKLLDEDRKDLNAVGITEDVVEDVTERMAQRPCAVSKAEASRLIDAIFSAPWKPRPQPKARLDVTEGMYVKGDDAATCTIAKVQKAVHGSGNLYAKRLNPTGGFDYVRGLIREIATQDGWRALTLDEAKAFGKLYGTCCVCGRTLTNEDSIAAGIGPICGGRLAG
jgi:hypothetical protein